MIEIEQYERYNHNESQQHMIDTCRGSEKLHGFDGGEVHRDKAGMTVMDQEITAEGNGGQIVDAACTVRDVAHDNGVAAAEPLKNILGNRFLNHYFFNINQTRNLPQLFRE